MSEYDADDPQHSKRKSQSSSFGGKLYIKKFFEYVERGQDLPVGTVKTHAFSPMTEDQQRLMFRILVTKQCASDVQYVGDKGVSKMFNNPVTVTVPVDMTAPYFLRGVCVRLSFGDTELGITCKRHSDEMEVEVDTIYIEGVEDTSYGRIA